MFLLYLQVYEVVTYWAKPFFNLSMGGPFYLKRFPEILRPQLIEHVPNEQKWVLGPVKL